MSGHISDVFSSLYGLYQTIDFLVSIGLEIPRESIGEDDDFQFLAVKLKDTERLEASKSSKNP